MNFKITPLFAVPLYQTKLSSLSEQEKKFIRSLEYKKMPANNGDYTENKFVLDSPELSLLKQRILEKAQHYLYEVLRIDESVEFKIENSWVNRHEKNDFAGTHRHSNSLVSGVYYIDVDNRSGPIIFEKNKSSYNLFTDTVEVPFKTDQDSLNVFNAEAWGITPENDELVLFPSLLYHSVGESRSDNTRYSLAFNMFPRGGLGGELNSLRI